MSHKLEVGEWRSLASHYSLTTAENYYELSFIRKNDKCKCYSRIILNTVIENSVNNQRKQNKHLRIKEDLHSLFGHIGSYNCDF